MPVPQLECVTFLNSGVVNVIALRGRAFERWLSHQSSSSVNGIKKRWHTVFRSSTFCFHPWYNAARRLSSDARALILVFSVSITVRKWILILSKNYPLCGTLWQQQKWTQMVCKSTIVGAWPASCWEPQVNQLAVNGWKGREESPPESSNFRVSTLERNIWVNDITFSF